MFAWVGLKVSTDDCLNEESTFIEVDLGSDINELVDALIRSRFIEVVVEGVSDPDVKSRSLQNSRLGSLS